MTRSGKYWILACGSAVCVLIFCLTTRLRFVAKENVKLRAALKEAEDTAASAKTAAVAHPQATVDKSEILRLRGEVAMLRSANRSAGNLRLEESDEQLRNWLAEIHGRTIVLDDVARLLTILNYNDPVVRVAAIQHLAKIGWNLTLNADLSDPERRDLISASELAIPSLIDKLEDTDPRVRSSAALALGSLTNAPDTIIPALIRSLDDQDEKVVLTAMHGLGNFENGLSKAIPVMERFSDSQDDEIREMATNAILRFRKSSQ